MVARSLVQTSKRRSPDPYYSNSRPSEEHGGGRGGQQRTQSTAAIRLLGEVVEYSQTRRSYPEAHSSFRTTSVPNDAWRPQMQPQRRAPRPEHGWRTTYNEREATLQPVTATRVVRHPVWLAGTAFCLVTLALLVSPVFAAVLPGGSHRPARALYGVPLGSGLSSGAVAAANAPIIDAGTASPPQVTQAEQPRPVDPAPSQGTYDLVGPPTISVARIESVLQKYGSPAVGKGQALYNIGVSYGINPAFALAFFVHESGCGTQGVARFTKSIGNIRWTEGYDNYEGYRSYGSWEQGIEDWYKLIGDLYIKGWGLRTVDAIIPVYAPYGDSNNPPVYIASVKRLVDEWR